MGTNKKVMIVDDDAEFLEELEEMLNMSSYDLIAVNDPTKVLDAAKDTRPDIILLDLKMPGKSGFEVANDLRYHTNLANIPVIAMTAYFKDTYIPLMDMCNIKKYIKKPFFPLDVINVIEDVIGKK